MKIINCPKRCEMIDSIKKNQRLRKYKIENHEKEKTNNCIQ